MLQNTISNGPAPLASTWILPPTTHMATGVYAIRNYGSLRRSRCLVAMHNAARDGFCQTECHFEDTYIVLNGNKLNSIIMSSDSTGNYPDYLDVITIFSGNSFCSVKCHRRKLIYILPEHIIEIIPNLWTRYFNVDRSNPLTSQTIRLTTTFRKIRIKWKTKIILEVDYYFVFFFYFWLCN